MKSEAAETDRIKVESRQSIHRRKMSKNSSIVNGADESLSYAAEDESVVRQINLAAAFHDHISCTKSAELCKIDGTREVRVTLPCQTDHIYANCSEMKNKSPIVNLSNTPVKNKTLIAEYKRLQTLCDRQAKHIKKLESELQKKDRLLARHKLEEDTLRARLEKKEGIENDLRWNLLRNRCNKAEENTDAVLPETNVEPDVNNAPPLDPTLTASTTSSSANSTAAATASPTLAASPESAEHSSTIPPVNLVTRYFGRRSKTVPNRALKRRYFPPKTVPSKKPAALTTPLSSSAVSVSSESEVHEEEMLLLPKPEAFVSKDAKQGRVKSSLIDIRKMSKKRGRRPKGISRNKDFLTTDRAYFLPDNQTSQSSLVCPETLIDVPSWKLKPVTSFYQMEGTENINDSVFNRRHLKCEQDERRRKRWDIQRLREQKASEKLKYKYCRETGNEPEKQKSQSFYPDPCHIQYIEITNQLPVLAFGHPIPLFQPSEFSLPWKWWSGENRTSEGTESAMKGVKKSRLCSSGSKVT